MVHTFEVEIAVKYGINAAIILQNIAFWVKKNEANDSNYFDGRYWTYNSIKAFHELFPYLSERQIKTAIDKLTSEELIITGNYNANRRDQTLWYALTDKGESEISPKNRQYAEMSNANSENVNCNMQKCQMQYAEMSNADSKNVKCNVQKCQMYYTDINTDINTDVNTDTGVKTQKRFVRPSVEDIEAYCRELQISINAEQFINHYDSNGWMVGKTAMKDWKATVRNWYIREHPGWKKPKKKHVETEAERQARLEEEEWKKWDEEHRVIV